MTMFLLAQLVTILLYRTCDCYGNGTTFVRPQLDPYMPRFLCDSILCRSQLEGTSVCSIRPECDAVQGPIGSMNKTCLICQLEPCTIFLSGIQLRRNYTKIMVSLAQPPFTKAPDLIFPMDAVSNGLMVGSIVGTVVGDDVLRPGVFGQALYIDGVSRLNVHYGPDPARCFGEADACTQGITIAFWLKMYPTGGDQYLPDTLAGNGRRMFFSNSGVWGVSTSLTSQWVVAQPWPLDIWVHIVGTWRKDISPPKIYYDGCQMAGSNGQAVNHNAGDFPHLYDIAFGCDYNGGGQSHMTLDNVMVWYDVLSPEEIRMLYKLGG